jgi:hypothetical protein
MKTLLKLNKNATCWTWESLMDPEERMTATKNKLECFYMVALFLKLNTLQVLLANVKV